MDFDIAASMKSQKCDRNRAVRIAGASGSAADRRHAFTTLAKNYPTDPVDVIVGDWLSEANMTSLSDRKASGSNPLPLSTAEAAYEATFLEALEPALEDIVKHGIKVAVNAGGLDAQLLWREVAKLVYERGFGGRCNIAWIEGDDVLPVIMQLRYSKDDSGLENICTSEKLRDWDGGEIIGAQAYLGGLGIKMAFDEGADIVICGRVSDASPVIGAAWWWHSWGSDNHDELARAFVAGHMIECSNYVCGGNFTGFKEFEGGWKDVGYPIAEIGKKGEVVITKQKGTGGIVTVDTCKAQLLYEIQGPWYFNSDVTAILTDIEFEHIESDRVAVKGVKGEPPPPTTKVGISARGGFQAEIHWFLVGLGIKAKARILESQVRHALGDASHFSMLQFSTSGTSPQNPTSQSSATVDFRIFAQARDVERLMPRNFLRPIMDLIMCSYPGATFHMDFRQGIPKPFFEYFVTLLPQSKVAHVCHTHNGRHIPVPGPRITKEWPKQQPSQERSTGTEKNWGETVKGPLGWLVHARSGDKGSNANVGFWVRSKDEYDWLRSLLSVPIIKELLAEEYCGKKIDRFELPNIQAVHFLLHDHLDRGASSSSTYDFLGKNVAEFLRARYVDLPKRFLSRGKL